MLHTALPSVALKAIAAGAILFGAASTHTSALDRGGHHDGEHRVVESARCKLEGDDHGHSGKNNSGHDEHDGRDGHNDDGNERDRDGHGRGERDDDQR